MQTLASSVRPISDENADTSRPITNQKTPPTTDPVTAPSSESDYEAGHPLWIEPDAVNEKNPDRGSRDADESSMALQSPPELEPPPQTLIFCDNSGLDIGLYVYTIVLIGLDVCAVDTHWVCCMVLGLGAGTLRLRP